MTILITGGTKGIGLAIAQRLARPGETLALAYRSDAAAAQDAKARIEAKGPERTRFLAMSAISPRLRTSWRRWRGWAARPCTSSIARR